MTDPTDFDLQRLDATATRAARGLQDHVLPRLDRDQALARVPASSPRRRPGRLLTVAAAVVVLVGSVAVLSNHNGQNDRSRLELDEDGNKLPTPQPGTLTPLGPRDGKDSLQLPLTVLPSPTGLRDGDTLTVSAPGFEPGESVGLVQCAQEAGGETREERGGIDACDITPFTSITADDAGVATGEYQVQRFLTTPLTGTVDCTSKAERCLVALGALSDYDRSGGFGITFAPPLPGDPTGPEIPTLRVTPAEGLTDGATVRVEGSGYRPNAPVGLQVCAKDPSACWATGQEIEPLDGPADDCFEGCDGGYGVLVDGDGRISADVPVWRFLPGAEPGTYVDCAVSECALRVLADDAVMPAPAPLAFVGGGEGPRPPAVAVDPSTGLASGDRVVIRGAGFAPGTQAGVSFCLRSAANGGPGCTSLAQDSISIDEEGTFAVQVSMGDPSRLWDESFGPDAPPEGALCDGVTSICTIQVDSWTEQPSRAPLFPPAPVAVTFRSD